MLDHYVSQVYLRQFYAPALAGRMYATKKSDLKSFCCDSKSVCRIEENSTNAYLVNVREVEDFLLEIEPKYTTSIAKLRYGKIDPECVAVIGGFAAYVSCCAPAAMRMHSAPLESLVASEAAILDRQGVLPRAPAVIGNKTLTELLADGTVRVNIDKKYPQAVGISTIRNVQHTWEIPGGRYYGTTTRITHSSRATILLRLRRKTRVSPTGSFHLVPIWQSASFPILVYPETSLIHLS
jgi:hypothetical protein